MRGGAAIYIEVFLLDNAVMTFLILRTASLLSRLKVIPRAAFSICLLSAAYSACAVEFYQLRALPFKVALLVVLCAAFRAATMKEFLKAALCVLLATFFYGGLCWGFFGVLYGGVLYATPLLRIALLAALGLTLVPPLFRSLVRKTPKRVELIARTACGSGRLRARVDTGNSLKGLTGRPVMIVRSDSPLFPPVSDKGRQAVAGMELIPYRTIDGGGLLYAIPARVRLRSGVELKCLAAAAPARLRGCDALIFDLEEYDA